ELFDAIDITDRGLYNMSVSVETSFEVAQLALDLRDNTCRTTSVVCILLLLKFVFKKPYSPLHVVSTSAARHWYAICKLLDAAGHDVFREYYVNVYGNQVILLGHSCLLRALEADGVPLKFSQKDDAGQDAYPEGPGLGFPSGGYHGDYITNIPEAVLAVRPELQLSPAHVSAAQEAATKGQHSGDFISELRLEDLAGKLGRAAIAHFLETHQRDLQQF